MQQIPKAACDGQGEVFTFPFEQGIGGDGGAHFDGGDAGGVEGLVAWVGHARFLLEKTADTLGLEGKKVIRWVRWKSRQLASCAEASACPPCLGPVLPPSQFPYLARRIGVIGGVFTQQLEHAGALSFYSQVCASACVRGGWDDQRSGRDREGSSLFHVQDLPGKTQKTSVNVPPRSMAKLKAGAMVL